jgi:hypothetical protein
MFEKLTKRKKLDKAKLMFTDAVDSDMIWQREAREDFNFRDGEQWTEFEKKTLEEELRPALTFNLTKSSVDLIMGMNEDNRVNFRCTPVEPTDDFLCEVLNQIYDWVKENYEFEIEEDAALESASICGRGYVAVDFSPDPKRFGEILLSEVAVPVHEVHFDPAARRPDLSDAGYITWDRWLTPEDFRIRYPKFPASKLDALVETGRTFELSANVGAPSEIFEEYRDSDTDETDYSRPLDLNFYDRAKRMVRLIHMEYWEVYKRFFGFNPETGEFEEFDGKLLSKIRKNYEAKFGMKFEYEVMMDKRVKWLQFIGDEILYDDISPLPFDGFSLVPMFAFKDVSQRSSNHFGIVRLMKDPQREINKRWSQALNLLNQQVQPGVFAEVDAFLDLDQAQASMKDPGSVTLLNSGGLGKMEERGMPQFPSAPMQMEEFSQEILRKITGINPDLLGQDRGRQEPGVVVRLRQQQGTTLLKPLFRSFKQMRKQLFKRILSIIMEYMPNEQLMRIMGSNDKFAVDPESGLLIDVSSVEQDPETGQPIPTVTANIRDVRNLEYNTQIEEAPGNMTKRTLELSAFMEMQGQGFPVPPEVIISRMDLPATDKKMWLEYINSQQQAQQEQQEEMLATEIGFKDRELSNEEQKAIWDFLVAIAKVQQQAEKDEKKMVAEGAKLKSETNATLLDFVSKLAATDVQEKGIDKQPVGVSTNGQGKQTSTNR